MILHNNTRASINLIDTTAPITLSDIILQGKMAADMEAEGEAGEMGTVGTDRLVIPALIVVTDPADTRQRHRKLLTGEPEMWAGVITKTTMHR